MRIERTHLFENDIRRLLVVDLASKNPLAAGRYLDLLDQALVSTARFPYSRQVQPNLGRDIRKIVVAPYVALYCVRNQRLIALRFLHGHQDITKTVLGSTL